jgi:hypothetical protein
MGRPSEYSQETALLICERLADGKSLRTICLDEAMPAKSTVFKWLIENQKFSDQYALAREAQADTLVDEMLDIADDGSNDWMERTGKDGTSIGWQENGEAIGRSRLRLDARKWIAAKLRPKKYADRIQQEVTGKDGGPIQHEDIRDRNLDAIEALSARLPSDAFSPTATPSEGATDPEPDA